MRCFYGATGITCSPALAKVLLVASWARPSPPSTVRSFRNLAGLSLSEATSASAKRQCFLLPGLACFVWDFFCWSDFSAGRQRSLHGFFTFVLLKVAGYSRTEPITS